MRIALALSVFYATFLFWILLFKGSFYFEDLPSYRNVNLVPFAQSSVTNGSVDLREILYNLVIFIPLGVYLSLQSLDLSAVRKLSIIFLISFTIELFQYILSIGASDISDLITNTSGGILGIGIYATLARLFPERADAIILVSASILTLLLIMFILMLGFANR
jgi:glycopeptide antibiotics resistance protein